MAKHAFNCLERHLVTCTHEVSKLRFTVSDLCPWPTALALAKCLRKHGPINRHDCAFHLSPPQTFLSLEEGMYSKLGVLDGVVLTGMAHRGLRLMQVRSVYVLRVACSATHT